MTLLGAAVELVVGCELVDVVMVESVVSGEGNLVDVAINVLGGASIEVILNLWLTKPPFSSLACKLSCARTGQFFVVDAIEPKENEWLPVAGTVVLMTIAVDVRIMMRKNR